MGLQEVRLSDEITAKVLELEAYDSNMQKTTLSSLLETRGCLVFNFIVGTWCPLCMKHVRDIKNTLELSCMENDFCMVIVSTEQVKKLINAYNKFNGENEIKDLLVISDYSKFLVNTLKIKIPILGFAKPATFILDESRRFTLISEGVPNLQDTICELNHYFKAG